MPSNEHPDMSGSGCDDDDPFLDEKRSRIQNEAFIAGAQQMREMLSRFVEQSPGNPNPDPKIIAQSMRLNWVPGWGDDPGEPDTVYSSIDTAMP